MSNKTKVKTYIRDGRLVKSYERKKKQILTSALLGGAALGVGAGLLTNRKFRGLSSKFLSEDQLDNKSRKLIKALIGGTSAVTGIGAGALGATGIYQAGKKITLNKDEKQLDYDLKTEKLKKVLPYQDKDLSAISVGINGAVNIGLLTYLGSLGYSGSKLYRKVMNTEPGTKAAKKLKNLGIQIIKKGQVKLTRENIISRGRYLDLIRKNANKAGIAGLALGGAYGTYTGYKNAKRLNERLGKKETKESNKDRAFKIAKGVGAAALGAGALYAAGKYLNIQNQNLVQADKDDLIERILKPMYQGAEIRKNAKLREAGVKLQEILKDRLRSKSSVKLLGKGELEDQLQNDLIKEELKRLGERKGKFIASRYKKELDYINKNRDAIVNMNPINNYSYVPYGITLGLGAYATKYGRNKDKQDNQVYNANEKSRKL